MTVWPNGSRSIPRVTSEYGPRASIPTPGGPSSTFHAGIDLVGFPINKSPFAGVVIFAAYNGGAGNEIRIQAANGDVARIKHNARFLVSVGQRVAEGQDVGVMGTTGASTGVHCHFETWPGNRTHINPRLYMAATSAAGGGATPIGKDNDMTQLFHELGSSPTLYALAGGSPGTPANWLETRDQQFANQLSAQIGASSAGLTSGSFAAWKAAYLAPVKVAGVQLDVGDVSVEAKSDPAVLAALNKIADGQAALLAATRALNPPG